MNCSNFKMGDTKFIHLIQERGPLYNSKLKDHHNKDVLDLLWMQVSQEMGMSVKDCKHKWTNLRNSYARHLRNHMSPCSSGVKRTRWFLADAMAFLHVHMQQRKPRKNDGSKIKNEQSFGIGDEDNVENWNDISDRESATVADFDQVIEPKMEFLDEKSDKYDQVMEPKIEFLEGKSDKYDQIMEPKVEFLDTQKCDQDSSLLTFVKGLIPDYQQLSKRRQRVFKQRIMMSLNELLDEQDMDDEKNCHCKNQDLRHSKTIASKTNQEFADLTSWTNHKASPEVC